MGGGRKKRCLGLKISNAVSLKYITKMQHLQKKKFFLRIPPAIHPAKVWCQLGLFDGMMGLKNELAQITKDWWDTISKTVYPI